MISEGTTLYNDISNSILLSGVKQWRGCGLNV